MPVSNYSFNIRTAAAAAVLILCACSCTINKCACACTRTEENERAFNEQEFRDSYADELELLLVRMKVQQFRDSIENLREKERLDSVAPAM